MRAWEEARSMGRRVFYERSTDTLRTCPENYLIAVRQRGRWCAVPDGMLKRVAPVAAWQSVLDEWQNGSTSDALAGEVARFLKAREVTP